MRSRPNRNPWPFLLLNVIVSAVTTLAVLYLWDTLRERDLPPPPPSMAETPVGGGLGGAEEVEAPQPTRALPPVDLTVIEISGVVGVGDLQFEVVSLRRVGEGDLVLTGWQLKDEGGNTYTFPDSPERVLFQDGALLLYTRGGSDTATEVYWNRTETVWEATELVTLLDPAGNVRATYRVP